MLRAHLAILRQLNAQPKLIELAEQTLRAAEEQQQERAAG
jgi:hypothetical protein